MFRHLEGPVTDHLNTVECDLLGCDAVSACALLPKFRRNVGNQPSATVVSDPEFAYFTVFSPVPLSRASDG
jgi:hypothetical protein